MQESYDAKLFEVCIEYQLEISEFWQALQMSLWFNEIFEKNNWDFL